MWSVTIDRTSLALADLVIDGNPFASSPNGGKFHLAEEDCTWPSFPMRRIYAPDSDHIDGRVLLKAAVDQGQMTLRVYAHAASLALLKAAMAELTAATSQFSYEITLTVDGESIGTYQADAERPLWGALDSGEVRAKLVDGTIVIPLNPPAGA